MKESLVLTIRRKALKLRFKMHTHNSRHYPILRNFKKYDCICLVHPDCHHEWFDMEPRTTPPEFLDCEVLDAYIDHTPKHGIVLTICMP